MLTANEFDALRWQWKLEQREKYLRAGIVAAHIAAGLGTTKKRIRASDFIPSEYED